MAEEKVEQRPATWRQLLPWTVLFRGFQVALDPKKLLLAAAGIVVMSLLWWGLAVIFYNSRRAPDVNEYRDRAQEYQKQNMPEGQAQERAMAEYRKDQRKYELLEYMAKPDTGRLATLPWSEPRGPNPFLMVTGQAGSLDDPNYVQSLGQFGAFLVEPLVKFLSPVVLLLHPEAGFWNRVYLLLVILATLATWALFGGAITRIAVVQVARNEKIRIMEALRFVARHYLSYLSAPLFPLALVALMLLGLIFFGVITMIPVVGEIWSGLLWPVVLLGCLAMAVILVGLVGWPLMYTTISAEGSDAFDGISRSYSYVYQSPWNFLGYSLVALLYGIVVVFFVGFMGSLTVYLAKWGTGMGTVTARDPGFLCVYAPNSFQWRTVLLQGTTLENGDPLVENGRIVPERYSAYLATFKWYNYVGAALVGFWIGLFFLMIVGFGYSYFWSALTIIYLLMRRQVDDTDMDEVYLEDEEEDNFGTTEPGATASGTPAAAPTTSLTMVEAPTLRPSAPPSPPPAAPPPAPVASTPAVATSDSAKIGDGETTAKSSGPLDE